jgi:hypothetical protein
MKKVALLVSTGILFTISGCSENSQKTALKSAPATVQASAAPTSTPPLVTVAAPLPALLAGQTNQQVWRSEKLKDSLGNAVALEGTSLDGKFDLVILQRGTYTSVSFVRHGRWASVYNRPAKGNLTSLRIKFDDGSEERVEWDELGLDTGNLYSVLWSYPAKTNAPIGPMAKGTTLDSHEGDERLLEDMMKHKTMLVEVEPGSTTQFEMTGLAHEIQKVPTIKIEPVLDARQTSE